MRHGKERGPPRSRSGYAEFGGIHLQFYEVGFAGGIIRSGGVPIAPGKRHRISVYGDKGPRERRSGIVHDVVPRGIPRNRAFRIDRGIHGSDVGFHGRFLRVFGVPRKGEKPDGGEYGQDGYHDDELGERESADFPNFLSRLHIGALTVSFRNPNMLGTPCQSPF